MGVDKQKFVQFFQHEKVEELYQSYCGDSDTKQTKFKRILIHVMCSNSSRDLNNRPEREEAISEIKRLWELGDNELSTKIQSYDEIIQPKDLQGYKPVTVHPEEHEHDNEYRVKKGLALILWNTEFLKTKKDNTETNGDGTELMDVDKSRDYGKNDRENIGKVFQMLKIDVVGQREFESIETAKTKEEKTKLEKMSGGNLNRDEVRDIIGKVKKPIEKENPDIFFCVVSTHGSEVVEKATTGQSSSPSTTRQPSSTAYIKHQLCFKDGMIGNPMYTKEIIREFDDNHCKPLKGKPRVFFIQACSSRVGGTENDDEGAKLYVVTEEVDDSRKEEKEHHEQHTDKRDAQGSGDTCNTHHRSMEPDPINQVTTKSDNAPLDESPSKSDDNSMETYEILCYDHCLVMFASAAGRTAYGREEEGGWLIQKLSDQLKLWQKEPKRDLLNILTRVCFAMSKRETSNLVQDYKSVPCIYHQLMKDIRLWTNN